MPRLCHHSRVLLGSRRAGDLPTATAHAQPAAPRTQPEALRVPSLQAANMVTFHTLGHLRRLRREFVTDGLSRPGYVTDPSPSSNPSSTLSLAPNPTQAASCCYGRTARTTTPATDGSDPRSRCRWASPLTLTLTLTLTLALTLTLTPTLALALTLTLTQPNPSPNPNPNTSHSS